MNKFKLKDISLSALLACLVAGLLALSGCGKAEVKSAESDVRPAETVRVRPIVSTWLGNPSRTFYGSGPWTDAPLEVVWKFKTKSISGRLHKDPWGGTSWPGR